MDPTTIEEVDLGILLATVQRIDERLERLERLLGQYEPLLAEATRRMAGPLKWLK